MKWTELVTLTEQHGTNAVAVSSSPAHSGYFLSRTYEGAAEPAYIMLAAEV